MYPVCTSDYSDNDAHYRDYFLKSNDSCLFITSSKCDTSGELDSHIIRHNPIPNFKGTPLFDLTYLRNGTRSRHCYNEVVIYTCPTYRCNFI